MLELNHLQGLREISMFSGAGGGILSSRLLGWETVQYVEWDSYCQEVLRARIKDGHIHDAPIHDDVSTFDGTPFRGNVDVIHAGFPCFVAGTMVLTMQGHIPIEDVREGDLVLTHLGRWRRVTATMVRDDAPVREIKAQGVPGVVCTDEHPFYSRARGRKWDNDRRSYDRVCADPEWMDAKDIGKAHYLAEVLPPVMDDDRTEAFWWLVGWYLAEGWTIDRDHGGRVILCAKEGAEADEVAKRIEAAGFHGTRSTEHTVVKFHICRNEFYDFLQPFGRYSHGKRVPGFVLQLPQEKAKAVLDGYLAGDGHHEQYRKGDGSVHSASTVNKALALGMAALVHRAYGVVASVTYTRKAPTCVIEGRTVNQRGAYTLTMAERNRSAFIEGDYGWKLVRSNKPHGVATVYNLSVEEDESYTADGAVVHNCTSFSLAGKQKAGDDERNKWPDTIRVIRQVQPRYAFLENVPGLLSGGHGYFGTVLGDLASSGYHATWSCLPAAAVRAPHRRDRLWILATRA